MEPYKSTPVFDETTLPAALCREHRTKAGTWGMVRVLEGSVKLTYLTDPPTARVVTPGNPGPIAPEQPHFVEPMGAMRMVVDFYSAAVGG